MAASQGFVENPTEPARGFRAPPTLTGDKKWVKGQYRWSQVTVSSVKGPESHNIGNNDKMRKRIQDEFTELPISRQRKYQLRMQRDRRCTECGEPAIQGSRCLKHLVKARERQRKKRGLKRRYLNTLSYRLEAAA
jgi:hypothetical protein